MYLLLLVSGDIQKKKNLVEKKNFGRYVHVKENMTYTNLTYTLYVVFSLDIFYFIISWDSRVNMIVSFCTAH